MERHANGELQNARVETAVRMTIHIVEDRRDRGVGPNANVITQAGSRSQTAVTGAAASLADGHRRQADAATQKEPARRLDIVIACKRGVTGGGCEAALALCPSVCFSTQQQMGTHGSTHFQIAANAASAAATRAAQAPVTESEADP